MPAIKDILALAIIIGFMGLVVVWMFFPPTGSETAMSLLNNVMGAMIVAFSTVIGYYFGSSASSSEKDKTITKLANGNASTDTAK